MRQASRSSVDPGRHDLDAGISSIDEVIQRQRERLAGEKELPLPEDRSGRRRQPGADGEIDPEEVDPLRPETQIPSSTTYVHDALPIVWIEHDLTATQVAVMHVLLSVAGWNIRGKNRRYASSGHRQVAQALGGRVSENTVLRTLHSLAKGRKNWRGNWVPGRQLIRLIDRGDRRRFLVDLLPLYKAVEELSPGATAFFMRKGG